MKRKSSRDHYDPEHIRDQLNWPQTIILQMWNRETEEEREDATHGELVSEAALEFKPFAPSSVPFVYSPPYADGALQWTPVVLCFGWAMNVAPLYSCLTLLGARGGVKPIPTLLTAPSIASGTRLVGQKWSWDCGDYSDDLARLEFLPQFSEGQLAYYFTSSSLHFIHICNMLCPFLLHRVARKMKVIPVLKRAQQFLHLNSMPSTLKVPSDLISVTATSFHSNCSLNLT